MVVFLIAAVAAAGLRLCALSRYFFMDGDSAVFALMAKHICRLQEFPAYMWLNHYAGALVSYLGALLFALFGVSSSTYMLAGLILSLSWVLVSLGIARKILEVPGYIAAACFVVVPPTAMLFYSLYPGGVQAETLLFSVIILYLLLDHDKFQMSERVLIFFWLGFFCGCGLWLSPGIFPSLLTVLSVFILTGNKIFKSRKIAIFAAGLMAGHLPAIIHNIYYPGATFFRLGGRFLNISRESLDSGNALSVLAHGLWGRALMIPGSVAQVPSLIARLLGTFNSLVFLIACVIVFIGGYRSFIRDRKLNAWVVLLIYAAWFVIFYSVAVGINGSRYVLGLIVIFPFVVGKMLSITWQRNKAFFYIILAGMLISNAVSIHKAWSKDQSPRYADLASWLAQRKYNFGFTDYLTAFPVIFYSNERVILSPTIFHPTFDDRYPEYTREVRRVRDPVYIIDTQEYPSVADQIELRLPQLGVQYQKDQFDRFAVYHGLSREVYPQELNVSANFYSGGT
jgi:hypothetical protein